MENQLCSKCSCEKPLSEFHKDKYKKSGYTSQCRQCRITSTISWNKSNPEKIRGYEFKRNRTEQRRINSRQYTKKRYELTKVSLKFFYNIRRKYGHIIRQQTGERGEVLRYIGCTRDQFINHIESKFRDHMTWDNYGSVWQIDHITPFSSIDRTNKEDVIRLAHYTNTQPLLIHENISKYHTYDVKYKKMENRAQLRG